MENKVTFEGKDIEAERNRIALSRVVGLYRQSKSINDFRAMIGTYNGVSTADVSRVVFLLLDNSTLRKKEVKELQGVFDEFETV